MQVTRTTTAPPGTVWSTMSDVRRWPEWLPTVEAVEPVRPDDPDRLGAEYDVRQPRLRPARWTVTAWDPGHGFTWQARVPGLRTVGRHTVTSTAQGTEITLAIEWTGPLAPIARAGYGRLTARYLAIEAAALANRVGLNRVGPSDGAATSAPDEA